MTKIQIDMTVIPMNAQVYKTMGLPNHWYVYKASYNTCVTWNTVIDV